MNIARRLLWTFGAILVLVVLSTVAFWRHPVACFNGFTELRLLFTGAQSRFMTVHGYRVHYYAMGPSDGLAVVLVHGLGGRSEDWENLAPFLTRAGYRVYLPDLPGYGQSEQPAGFSYSVPDEAEVIKGFFDKLNLERVDLGGWSMGGWIVQRVAAENPDRIRKLVLFDSAGLAIKPAWNTALFTPDTPEQLAELDNLLMPHPPPVPPFVAADILRMSRRNAWVIHRALASMLAGGDTTDQLLPGLRMPVLLVWGEMDHIVPLSAGKQMHQLIPQSELEVVAGCGHLAPRQCATRIAPVVVAFLRT
jgi:pimeloyl-ACP methyl ester carboxylesterase